MFSSPFNAARTAAYISLLIFQVVLLGLAAGYAPLATAEAAGFDGFYLMIIIILLAFTALTLIVVPLFVFILPTTIKHSSVVKSLWFELAWLTILTACWTGATARLIIDWRYLKDYYCVVPTNPGAYRRFPGDKSRTEICAHLDSILAFDILSWVTVLLLTVGLLAYGISKSRKHRSVWSSTPGSHASSSSKANQVDLNGDSERAYHR